MWSGLQEDFEKKLPKKEAHSVEDSIGLSGDKRLMGREQHFDDIPVDLLENFLKSMQLSPIENAPQTFDEKPIEGYREDVSFIELRMIEGKQVSSRKKRLFAKNTCSKVEKKTSQSKDY